MMGLMMAICIGVLLLFAVIPAVGFPLGIAIVAVAVALVFHAPDRLTRHGGSN